MQCSINPTDTLDLLNDIAACIQIESAFQIRHLRYQPLALPEAVINRYQQLPHAVQRRYQCQKLRNYLYDIYFSHEQDTTDDLVDDGDTNHEHLPLQNDAVRGINQAFFQQIQAANHGKGYFDPGWQITTSSPTHLKVQKQGLTVQIEPNYHLQDADRQARIGDQVAIRLPKNRFESGFYVAVGNAGMVPESALGLEIYFNINPTGAVTLMRCLTQGLNDRQIAFTFKILYDPTSYERYDAGILNLERQHYPEIFPLLKTIYQQTQPEMNPAIPLFTKMLAPGLGLAEEPAAELRDFGLHRCQLVAEGLLAAWEMGNESTEHRLSCIRQQFAQNQIDLQAPYLNPGSVNIYLPLD